MTSTSAGPRAGQPRSLQSLARDPILQSKIAVPALPVWAIPRPRITKRMAQGTRGAVTLITGPPGAGKTMATVSWAVGYDGGPVAWVTLDEFDDSPEAFWCYVVAALRRAGVAVPGAVTSSLARREAGGRAFLLRIASALAGRHPPVTLVLDELHCATNPALVAGLAYVLRSAQPGLRLVGVSRTDPALPLQRYRLTGDLTEIRADDLAFTVPEARQLMSRHGITLSAASLAHLTESSEGWAAGLRMAAVSMAGHPDPEQFVRNLIAEDRAITGYLMEQVLDTRPADVRELLLRTSILDQVNADIAAALTDGDQVPAVLDTMARANAFVQPVGQDWYRYHALFRAVLRMRLQRESPQIVADLHRRAATWYQRKGMLADAVGHATKAGDGQLTARIMINGLTIGQLIGPGHGELPSTGFKVVTEGVASPQSLLAAAAVALSEARDQTAEASLAAADRMLGKLPEDSEIAARFAAAALRFGMACRRGDLGAADAATAAAAKLLEKRPEPAPSGHSGMAAWVLAGRGVVELWSGRLDEAAGLFTRAAGLLGDIESPLDSRLDSRQSGTSGRHRQLAACRGYRALVDALRGRPGAAARFAVDGNSTFDGGSDGHRDPASALALALVSLDRGDLSASRGQLRLAEAVLRVHPHRLLSAIGCLTAARVSLADGRACAALEIIERARHGWSPPSWFDRMLATVESRAHAACGEAIAAVDAARRAGPESSLDARVTLSRAWLAAGDLPEARRTLAPALEASAGEAAERVRLEAWLTDALLSSRSGDLDRGRRSLERALVLGEAARVRLPFITERTWVQSVLARHRDLAGAHSQFLGPELVARSPVPARRPARDLEAPVIVDPLSCRERDVLRHVSEMLDTADIAAEMHISVNTVKSHLKSIFQKLGTSDRRAAVRRARHLNLL
jgi:LuxR family transcriptional regulator, maltose regulon positive regulatory protein